MSSNIRNTSESTVAATFADQDQAHNAARALKNEGFDRVWIGLVKPADEEWPVSSREASPAAKIEAENWFQRVFGDVDQSLRSTLIDHGVSEQDADRIKEADLGSVLLTVDTHAALNQALQII